MNDTYVFLGDSLTFGYGVKPKENWVNKLKQKYSKKDIKLKIDSNIKERICEISNYKEFGARKIKKIIKDKLESVIIDDIINSDSKNIVIKNLKEESPV